MYDSQGANEIRLREEGFFCPDSWKGGLMHGCAHWNSNGGCYFEKMLCGCSDQRKQLWSSSSTLLRLDQCDSTLMILLRSWSREYRCCTQVNGCKSHIFRQAMLSSELSFLTMMLITRYISYWLIFCTLILTASKSVGSSTSLESLTPTQPEKRHFHLTP